MPSPERRNPGAIGIDASRLLERLRLERRAFSIAAGCALFVLIARFAVAAGGAPALSSIELGAGLAAVTVCALLAARRWRDVARAERSVAGLDSEMEASGSSTRNLAAATGASRPYRAAAEGRPRTDPLAHGEIDTSDLVPASRPSGAWVAIAALAIFAVLLGVAGLFDANPRPEMVRLTFTERVETPGDLGLETPVASAGRWSLEDHEHATGGRALVNHAGEPGGRAAVAVASGVRSRDVRVSTRCKVAAPSSGCGLVFRYADLHNHYVAHMDVATGVVELGAVVDGVERSIGRRAASVTSDVWQDLAVEARGDRIAIRWNGAPILELEDVTHSAAGAAGLWAPSADAVMFDELVVEAVQPEGGEPLDELLPLFLPRGRHAPEDAAPRRLARGGSGRTS